MTLAIAIGPGWVVPLATGAPEGAFACAALDPPEPLDVDVHELTRA